VLYPNGNLITFMLLAVIISFLSVVFGGTYRLEVKTRNALIITANGPVVWGVAVCVGVAWFLPILVNGTGVTRHGVVYK
jgi:hypothetical protein